LSARIRSRCLGGYLLPAQTSQIRALGLRTTRILDSMNVLLLQWYSAGWVVAHFPVCASTQVCGKCVNQELTARIQSRPIICFLWCLRIYETDHRSRAVRRDLIRNESYMGALRRKIGNDLVISPSVAAIIPDDAGRKLLCSWKLVYDPAERAQAGAQRADDGIAAVQTEWPFALTAC
jgi:hypothetical protein